MYDLHPPLHSLDFTLPIHEIHFAPWEYMVFMVDITPTAKQPEGIDTYSSSLDSIPSIITYNYTSVITVENEFQQVDISLIYSYRLTLIFIICS